MIFLIKFIFRWVVMCVITSLAFKSTPRRYFKRESFKSSSDNQQPQRRVINIRFINNLTGQDIITTADEGELLLGVGDRAGVKLPRACRLGLCGSCTCELQDPRAIATDTNPRDGFATIRACSYKCAVPEGMDEMVVDVKRLQTRKTKSTTEVGSSKPTSAGQEAEQAEYVSSITHYRNLPLYNIYIHKSVYTCHTIR